MGVEESDVGMRSESDGEGGGRDVRHGESADACMGI